MKLQDTTVFMVDQEMRHSWYTGIDWKCQLFKDGNVPSIAMNKTTKCLIWPFLRSCHEDRSHHAPLPHKFSHLFGLSNSAEAHNSLGIALSFKLKHIHGETYTQNSSRYRGLCEEDRDGKATTFIISSSSFPSCSST
jgi:hypothetical protein